MKNIILKGKTIVQGEVSGKALVTMDPVSFLGMVNYKKGTFDYPGHELQGQKIKDKILVYPFGKGSSGDTIRMWMLEKFNQKPAAIIFNQAEPIHVQGAILLNIPTVYGFKEDVCQTIKTGDYVTVKNNIVTISATR